MGLSQKVFAQPHSKYDDRRDEGTQNAHPLWHPAAYCRINRVGNVCNIPHQRYGACAGRTPKRDVSWRAVTKVTVSLWDGFFFQIALKDIKNPGSGGERKHADRVDKIDVWPNKVWVWWVCIESLLIGTLGHTECLIAFYLYEVTHWLL